MDSRKNPMPDNGLNITRKNILIIVLLALAIITAATVLSLRGCSETVSPQVTKPVATPPSFDAVQVKGFDLGILARNDSITPQYQDFGSGGGGLRVGNWTSFGDSLRYECDITCTDSTFQLCDSSGHHYFPGLVNVVTFYKGKAFQYYSKSVFDWGNTNCLPGVVKGSFPEPFCMGITAGCLDSYFPQTFTKPFEQGDKYVLLVVIDAANNLHEQNRKNNYAVLPLRTDTTYFDPHQGVYPGAVLDWAALNSQNRQAIGRWLKRNFVGF
jgi:hypothetical protein